VDQSAILAPGFWLTAGLPSTGMTSLLIYRYRRWHPYCNI